MPALLHEGGCSSAIELRNLGEEPVAVDVEIHRADGTLSGLARIAVPIAPGEKVRKQVDGAWVKIREFARARPIVAIKGSVDCLEGETVRTEGRQAAYPARDPWFTGDGDGSILMINTSGHESTASLCYSTGTLYSMPGEPFRPVCIASFDVQIPSFGSRTFRCAKGEVHTLSCGLPESKLSCRCSGQ